MECVICLEPIENEREAWVISCENYHPKVFYHEICADGVIFSGDRWQKPRCPVCRAEVSEKKLYWIPPPPVIEITDWVNPPEFNENSVKIIRELHQKIERLIHEKENLLALESELHSKIQNSNKKELEMRIISQRLDNDLSNEITKNREMSEKLQRLEENRKKSQRVGGPSLVLYRTKKVNMKKKK